MTLPTRGLQFQQDAQGAWNVEQMPGTPTFTVEDPEPVFDWLAALNLPKSWAQLEAMAAPKGMSPRRLRFVLVDESLTRLPGVPRFKPQQWIFFPGESYHFTLAHLGFVIGSVDQIWRAKPGDLAPGSTEGSTILAEARLYDSPLASAAWRGIQQGIFGHACAVVHFLKFHMEDGSILEKDELLEVALIDRPGCKNAKILKTWES